jgi:hypothetical protein
LAPKVSVFCGFTVYLGFTLQLNGQYIEWKQLWEIYEKLFAMSIQSHGLTIAPKLKLEHLKLTSYSRMRVDLAAQISDTPSSVPTAAVYVPSLSRGAQMCVSTTAGNSSEMSSSVATATHTPLSSSHSRIQQGRRCNSSSQSSQAPL